MKSFGGLWGQITGEENLCEALRLASRGKRERESVRRFWGRAEEELGDLRRELLDGSYQPGAWFQFRIRDPKPRTISCAPFRDRIVHHALCAVIAPLLERSFIDHSYACRRGKGTERAVWQAWQNMRPGRYVVKMDVASFFDAIPHDILLDTVLPLFREREVKALVRKIVLHPLPGQQPGRGLPVGNLTSQWLANHYLSGMDHYVLQEVKPAAYLRYMDDFFCWVGRREAGWRAVARVRCFLEQQRGLALKERAVQCHPVEQGLALLGMRVYPRAVRMQNAKWRRMHRKCERCEQRQAGISGKARYWEMNVLGTERRTARPGAITASCVAAVGTTTAGTAVRPIATGMGRATPTGTTGSGSSAW